MFKRVFVLLSLNGHFFWIVGVRKKLILRGFWLDFLLAL